MNDQRRGGYGRCPAPIRKNPLDSDAGIPLAMAYVKNERFEQIYEPLRALALGTVFPELNKPFYGAKSSAQNNGRCCR